MILSLVLSILLWSHPHHYKAHPVNHHPRSLAMKHEFWRQSGHPHGWPGHVVDHVIPLVCGGEDTPANMSWQSTAEAKAKDTWERRDCSIYNGRTH